MAVNKYKITFKQPATGELDSVIIERSGQPTLAEVGAYVQQTGISTETAFISGDAFLSVEHDDTPEPSGSPYNYAEEAANSAAVAPSEPQPVDADGNPIPAPVQTDAPADPSAPATE